MEELGFNKRKGDLQKAFKFGNHKDVTQKPELLKELVQKDITHSHGVVIPLKNLKHIPGSLLAPMNIQK